MIYINTNLEILADHTRDEHGWLNAERAEEALDVVGCWGVIAEDAGMEWEPSSSFRDWRGGRFCQFHNTIGDLVAYTKPEESEIARKIADAMSAALEGAQ